ncbi:MAG: cytochrome c biogenesis protein ResB [Candidatus Limnocylindrales bacterium]
MATPAALRAATSTTAPTSPLARAGRGLWGLFTSVDFAVVQIIALAVLAAIGMTLKQLPDFAFRSAGDYAAAMDTIHGRYDPTLGSAAVEVLERLGAFAVFRSPWFSLGLLVLVLSIVICTLDRTPKLWRGVSDVRVVQPEPFYDPRLPDRAAMTGVAAADVARILRRRGFRVRQEATEDGSVHVHGDRHQYTKMATLLTHLGLITFLLAAAVTSRFGDEQGLVVPEGESLTVQPIGTPGLMLVKNVAFDAPGFETGRPTDFTTDLAVYRDGSEIAHKTIRVNDPLSVGGYTFHQNGFGAAPHLIIRDRDGEPLWDAAVPLTDSVDGLPYVSMAVPGRDLGLNLLLSKDDAGRGVVLIVPYRIIGKESDGSPIAQNFDALALIRGETRLSDELGLSIELTEFSQYTLLIAKRDPGQGLIWLAFGLLISGITISFYLPRRRVWGRIAPDGRLGLVWRSDRYVDVEREFGRVLDDLVAARRPGGY